MKKIGIALFLLVSMTILNRTPLKAQSFEIQQLILNIQKLSQLKSILDQMYKGYQVLSAGYNTIKDLSAGNFSLHKTFLDGLLNVSPTVKKYKRILDIVTIQQQIVQQQRKAFSNFKLSQVFNERELDYIEKIYAGLFDRSLKNLDELIMVITAGELRMNDAERLMAIDRIYDDMKDKQNYLRHFNEKTTVLALQRKKVINENATLNQLYNIKQ
jgi:hypothetical protein